MLGFNSFGDADVAYGAEIGGEFIRKRPFPNKWNSDRGAGQGTMRSLRVLKLIILSFTSFPISTRHKIRLRSRNLNMAFVLKL